MGQMVQVLEGSLVASLVQGLCEKQVVQLGWKKGVVFQVEGSWHKTEMKKRRWKVSKVLVGQSIGWETTFRQIQHWY